MKHDFADDLRGPDAPAWRDRLERFAFRVVLNGAFGRFILCFILGTIAWAIGSATVFYLSFDG